MGAAEGKEDDGFQEAAEHSAHSESEQEDEAFSDEDSESELETRRNGPNEEEKLGLRDDILDMANEFGWTDRQLAALYSVERRIANR